MKLLANKTQGKSKAKDANKPRHHSAGLCAFTKLFVFKCQTSKLNSSLIRLYHHTTIQSPGLWTFLCRLLKFPTVLAVPGRPSNCSAPHRGECHPHLCCLILGGTRRTTTSNRPDVARVVQGLRSNKNQQLFSRSCFIRILQSAQQIQKKSAKNKSWMCAISHHLGVSKNKGTPKWMVYN